MAASSADNPYVDAQGRTDAETYLMGCLDGSVVAGRRIKQLAEKMLPRIHDGYKQWRFDVDAATRPVEFIERFCKIPSGKLGQPFVMEPYQRCITELIFGFVDENERRPFQYALIEEGRKNGKAVSLDTEIPTPVGWKLMRDIHAGDYVFGQDGKPSKVIMESEVFDKPMYLLRFEDGSTVKASCDHVWTVREPMGEWFDMTTQEIADAYDDGINDYLEVPRPHPVEYPSMELADPPYDVGVSCCRTGAPIPGDYMQASVAQRQELMQGLLDECGWEPYEQSTYIEFVSPHRALVTQAMELASSLGLSSSLADSCPGTLELYMPAGIDDGKLIVSVERIPNEPSKSISIDNQSHLYLVGRNYTATHNSSWGAAIELYCLVADGEGAPQIYNAATSKGQASLAYGAVWRMVRQSPKLSKYLRKGTVTERAENGIICDGNMGYVIPLSKQSDHLDGLDVHMCLFDEMAAAEDRSVFDLIRQGTGAREQPLMLAITTQGFVRDNLWDHEREYAIKWLEGKIEDDRILAALFELDDRSEIWDEAMWPKANPGLGTIKKVEYLRAQVLKAKNDPSYMPTLLTKDFNQPANQASAWLDFESAVNTTLYTFDPKVFRYCILGFDAADTLDLNAATALFMRPGDNHIYRRSMYWIADEQVKINSNNQRGRDGVPYQEWADRGLIRIVPGNNVDRRVFLDWVQELADEGLYTRYIGLDPWGFKPYLPDLKMMVGDTNVEEVRQGAMTLSLPMKQLRADMRDGRIINNHNPIDEWCNLNVSARIDRNENVTPVKKSGATTRIDGFMALLDAYVTFLRHEADYKTMIGWHE